MNINDYPFCERCGSIMYPVFFIDEEEKNDGYGHIYKTGRVRRAVSHFECDCGKRAIVDDSLDGPWCFPQE